MALAGFAPGVTVGLSVGTTSTNVALPLAGTPPTAWVTNIGDRVAFVALGIGSGTTASTSTSQAIPPNGSLALTIGTNTFLAAVTLAGVTALNITTGT